jgi:hypothetical protein
MSAAAPYQTFEVIGSELWRVDRDTGGRWLHDILPTPPLDREVLDEPYSPTNPGADLRPPPPPPVSSPVVSLRSYPAIKDEIIPTAGASGIRGPFSAGGACGGGETPLTLPDLPVTGSRIELLLKALKDLASNAAAAAAPVEKKRKTLDDNEHSHALERNRTIRQRRA